MNPIEPQVLIFDFDGLILDTEGAEVDILRRNFEELGLQFDMDEYVKVVGGSKWHGYIPWEIYADAHNPKLDPDAVREKFKAETEDLLTRMSALPGVNKLIHEAKAAGIKLAVGSSSPRVWVLPKLDRLGISAYFDTVVCRDDAAGEGKPSPAIFLMVLDRLGVKAENALVLEDSYNGILAAKRAGIRCVCVPNSTTARQDHSLATLTLKSLEELNLGEYLNFK